MRPQPARDPPYRAWKRSPARVVGKHDNQFGIVVVRTMNHEHSEMRFGCGSPHATTSETAAFAGRVVGAHSAGKDMQFAHLATSAKDDWCIIGLALCGQTLVRTVKFAVRILLGK